jgi:excisionase family DNA binding protein
MTTVSLQTAAGGQRLAVSDAEAAALIDVGRTKFRELLRTGEIRALHIGRRLIVPVSEIQRFIDQGLAEGPLPNEYQTIKNDAVCTLAGSARRRPDREGRNEPITT